MSQIETLKRSTFEAEALMSRYNLACDFTAPINRDIIVDRLREWLNQIGMPNTPIRLIESSKEIKDAARAARAARAAWDAWDARAARDARDAWAARAARAARDARDAWAARAARAARDAWAALATRAAWAAWAAWDARDASYLSAIIFGAIELNQKKTLERWTPFFEAFEAGAWLLFPSETLWVCVRSDVKMDERRRLHSDKGAAFEWLSDVREYYWHGVNVPQHVIMQPSKITVAEIDGEKNVEIRRVMIERYGQSRYLINSGAKVISTDDYGILYRKELRDDEPILMVKVVNSTPEPDGTFKDYFMRVHPQLFPLPNGMWSEEKKREWMSKQRPQELTAHNAVASLSGMRGEYYQPSVET